MSTIDKSECVVHLDTKNMASFTQNLVQNLMKAGLSSKSSRKQFKNWKDQIVF